MKIRNNYTCPLELTHDIIKGKWKPLLLWQIGKNKFTSFSDLKRNINNISEKMLMEQLNELLMTDLISKKKTDSYPLKVEYLLTKRGEKLLDAIMILQEVGTEMMNEN